LPSARGLKRQSPSSSQSARRSLSARARSHHPVIGCLALHLERVAQHFILRKGRRRILAEQDVQIARFAELAGEPAQFLAQMLIILAAHGVAEKGQRRAQAAERHPRLVQGVGIARLQQGDLVQPEMAQAGGGDRPKRIGFAHLRIEADRIGLGRAAEPAFHQRVAALVLAERAEAQRRGAADLLGKLEQGGGLAVLELQLELDERRALAPGADRAFVQHDLDEAAAMLDLP
jgi:hypothetical protein